MLDLQRYNRGDIRTDYICLYTDNRGRELRNRGKGISGSLFSLFFLIFREGFKNLL